MTRLKLSPEDLLAGANTSYEVMVPPHVLNPANPEGGETEMTVTLKPLTIGTFQLIMKAARNDPGMIPLLMIKEALVEPGLNLGQVRQLHLGMIEFLIGHIRQISGLTEKKSP